MKRVMAVLAAVALVLAAILVRGLVDSRGDGQGVGSDGELSIICGPELLAVCNQLAEELDVGVTSQEEQVTAQRLATGELELTGSDVWLTAGPWPAVTEAGGSTMPPVVGSEVLARSPAVIVAKRDRIAAIEGSCGTVTWSCIGERAGEPWTELGGEPTWGAVKVGLPETDAGDGMVTVNQAVASRIGRTDFATNDLDGDPTVGAWFDRLASESRANATATTPLTRFLRVPGSLGVVGALEAEAISQLSTAATAGTVGVTVPEPVATGDVRLWAGSEQALEDALERIGADRTSEALEANGWRVVGPDGPRPPRSAASIGSVDIPLPEDDGLPAPGVVSAVDTRWENVR